MAQPMQSTDKHPRLRGYACKIRRQSLRVDMTPMVDLGFLLISFFIFTSTMTDPKGLQLFMPSDKGAPMPTAASGALSIIITGSHQLYYYEGAMPNNRTGFKSADLSTIRKVIIDKKQRVVSAYQGDADCEAKAKKNPAVYNDCSQKKLAILIKPTAAADYRTIVSLLDEMTINRIARYAILEPEGRELLLTAPDI
ncbi:biopolymer transporter ExbD [Niabella terrae]